MSDEEFLARSSPADPANGAESAGGGRGAAMPPELQSLEAALATLRPAAPRLDRDRVMFAAGRASVTPRSGSWWRSAWRQVAPLAAAVAAAVLVAVWLWRPEPQIIERIVYLPAPQPMAVADALRPVPAAVSPQKLDSIPAPVASAGLDRPPALPRWLTALIAIQPEAKPGLPTRWLVGGPHFESLAAHSESPHDTDAAPPDADDSHPASPYPATSEPPLSRQSLDRLLNDLTAVPCAMFLAEHQVLNT